MKTTEWNNGQIPAGEGLGMLDLIKNISKNTKYLQTGGIVIYNDNKKLIKEIEKKVSKESDCTQEAEAVVERIRRELKISNIDITIEYANNKPRTNIGFSQQLGPILMKRCDEEARQQYKQLIDGE